MRGSPGSMDRRASCLLLLLLLLLSATQRGRGLKNVSLLVFPPAVQRGQHASLLCLYDLEGAPLYSVKWYRGRLEFYRYSPSEKPPTKIFPFPGIHVDLSVSNDSLVVLRNVGFNLSGNFSCEVTADAPSFSTKTVHQHLLVVALPEEPPRLEVEGSRYYPGDILKANCSSAPSRPASSIAFLINDSPVGYSQTVASRQPDQLESSWQSLTTQLFPSHFAAGRLVLRCTAYIGTLYRQSAEARFYSKGREPVPERVTSPNMTSRTSTSLQCLLLVLSCQFFR
ncbi:uncharacterized protein LOC134543238 [Bacillus rossius redtenbacheri]|uniref:uncharacterized protein LOC134543238 n=1 Tax=Bacillus rossius redtenbacheri TaxID=93214 RepID=UPI002FDEF152